MGYKLAKRDSLSSYLILLSFHLLIYIFQLKKTSMYQKLYQMEVPVCMLFDLAVVLTLCELKKLD